ncbi:hypothetical protein QVD17_08188 [Tagetes erecta]|uniref:Uncharacterized protein n=1 Tax=Tagetes erecta TaxID=13708 RepID=A0AAD8L263_TARER|nr:hypothetical protein QVD17_08188 [Tagetes erecta]
MIRHLHVSTLYNTHTFSSFILFSFSFSFSFAFLIIYLFFLLHRFSSIITTKSHQQQTSNHQSNHLRFLFLMIRTTSPDISLVDR